MSALSDRSILDLVERDESEQELVVPAYVAMIGACLIATGASFIALASGVSPLGTLMWHSFTGVICFLALVVLQMEWASVFGRR